MIRILFVLISFSILVVSCSEKNSGAHKSSGKDSTHVADSIEQTLPLSSNYLLTYEQRQGKHIYAKYCTVCHGEQGQGDGFNAFNLDPKPRNFTDTNYMSALSDIRLMETINQGGRGVNKSPLMPSWGGRLSKEEVEYLVMYIRHFAESD